MVTSDPKAVLASDPILEVIQFLLPRRVLISPLCAVQRFGCALAHEGKVLVEKRECTTQTCDLKSSAWRSR